MLMMTLVRYYYQTASPPLRTYRCRRGLLLPTE